MIRIYPVTRFDKPIGHDSYYHIRIAERIKETSNPLYQRNPWPGRGRPHIYPPLYHLSLLVVNSLFGLSITTVTKLLLPLVSGLIAVPVYKLIERHRDRITALAAAGFTALNPLLIYNSYESPQIIGVVLSIGAIYFLVERRHLLGGCLIGLTFLFNPFSAIFLSIPLLLYMLFKREFRGIGKFFSPVILSVLGWFSTRASFLESLNFFFGPKVVSPLLYQSLLSLLPIVLSLIAILFALTWVNNKRIKRFIFKDDLTLLLCIWITCFFLLFLSFLFTPMFYPWRQLLFLSMGLILLFSEELVRPRILDRKSVV